jgi:hypothetical protein
LDDRVGDRALEVMECERLGDFRIGEKGVGDVLALAAADEDDREAGVAAAESFGKPAPVGPRRLEEKHVAGEVARRIGREDRLVTQARDHVLEELAYGGRGFGDEDDCHGLGNGPADLKRGGGAFESGVKENLILGKRLFVGIQRLAQHANELDRGIALLDVRGARVAVAVSDAGAGS